MLDCDDIVNRLIYSPSFDGDKLDIKKSFFFQERDGYKESVNCKRLVINYPDDIHAMGNRNSHSKKVYKGFSESIISKIKNISERDYRFDIEHTPISGNPAHCDIVLKFPSSDITTRPSKSIRQFVIDKLATTFEDIIEP
ncbi:MAG: hypothetical protein QM529_02955 [Hydrotalea sp.]|nr:hypothetical protein [Hydrotalea sp.]